MGSNNQVFGGTNPNMKNYSFTAPEGWMLMIDLLIEWGIFQSRSEILRNAVRRILWENLDIIKHLKDLIQYVPLKRAKPTPNRWRKGAGRVINNGYTINYLEKGLNEE